MKLTRNPLYTDDGSLDRTQYDARRLWRRASEQMRALLDGLMLTNECSAEKLHLRLEARLCEIKRLRARAKELDPKVTDRTTISSGKINP